jgi:FkbM family methyltransferase
MLKKLIPEFIKAPLRSRLNERRFVRSQAGQDLWVFGEVFNEQRNGFFLDIGAHDGVAISNTYVLESRYEWRGICVEANPDIFEELRKNRHCECVNACLDQVEGTATFEKNGVFGGITSSETDNKPESSVGEVIVVATTTLGNLLKKLNAPHKIDYLSIDIEGAEERVLKDFPFTDYQISCITIERPSRALRIILEANDFTLIRDIPGLDCFYLHKDMRDRYLANLFAFYTKRFVVLIGR